jgi:hypothetical protein
VFIVVNNLLKDIRKTTGLPLDSSLVIRLNTTETNANHTVHSQNNIHSSKGHSMGRLTQGTINNYRARLKKLRKVMLVIEDDHPERPKVLREIEKLTNQLGMEMTDLEASLARGPGRPRQNPDVDYLLPKLPKDEPNRAETQEERDLRFTKEQQERRDNLMRTAVHETDAGSIKESENELVKLMELANDKLVSHGGDDERPESTTDNARAVATNRE